MTMAVFSAMANMIVTVDGTSMQVYNIEPAQKWIFYTESADENADIKRLPIDRVFAYKIGDGPMTTVSATPAAPAQEQPAATGTPAKSGKLDPVPAADNEALIAAYNDHPQLAYIGKNPQPDKYTNDFISLWGIDEGSILSDENVEIGFEPVYSENDNRSVIAQRIKVVNKTDAPIYIDLASCYRFTYGGCSIPYFTNAVYTESSSNTTGGSLNLGAVAGALGVGGAVGTLASGLNIGRAATQSAGITKAEQQIITILPHSMACLPGEKFSSGKKIVECYEPIFFRNTMIKESYINNASKDGNAVFMTQALDQKTQKKEDNPRATRESLNIRRWIQTDYTPEESPKKIGRIITYSTSPDFSTYTSLPINLYMRGAYGLYMGTGTPPSFYFNDKNYDSIIDKEHFIVGKGYVKSK